MKPRKLRLPVEFTAESFRCGPYSCVLTREKCAMRFAFANPVGRLRPGHEAISGRKLQGASCTGCAIGATHHAGERHPEAVTLGMPASPAGHVPPKRTAETPIAPSFDLNVARAAESAKERRLEDRKERRKNQRRTWASSSWEQRRLKYVKPCPCGKPKTAVAGARYCDECRTAKNKRRNDRATARSAARWHALKAQRSAA